MDDQLQHDPRTKLQIKDAIFNFLYKPLEDQFNKRLEDIIDKNCTLSGLAEKSFTYKGENYCSRSEIPPRRLNRLVKPLYPIMDIYLKEKWQLNNYELPFVIGFINQVLNASNSFQDYLSVFPQSLHYPIERLALTCPCRANKLSLFDIQALQNKNQTSINLLKQRMVVNLLI